MEINTKTVKFIGFLNELAKMSANGIRPFSTATTQDKDVLLYDDKHPIETEKSICIHYTKIGCSCCNRKSL